MKNDIIIGREYEQKLIQDCCNSGKAELIAIYGRRRVGKTYLVKTMFNGDFAFSFTGLYDVSRQVMLEQFRKKLESYSNRQTPRFKDWYEAFDMLRDYLESLNRENLIVFLDELPWMDTRKSNFLPAFSFFWNDWASTVKNLKIIVCGSATTWMMSNVIGDKGGLYGRVSRAIYLPPFSLRESEEYLKRVKGMDVIHRQTMEIYMTMGGIPYYLNMMEKGVPIDSCIDRLFFAQGAPLRGEFDFLFRSLFSDSKIYRMVIETLSSKMKGMTRQELISTMKIKEGGKLSVVLENLLACDFIRRYTSIGKSERDAIYQLTDLFSLFHLCFVDKNSGQDEHFWRNSRGDGSRRAWSGYAFEQVCLHHLPQIKKVLGISGILCNAYSWISKPSISADGEQRRGAQIDLLIDRADNVINLCEMKYASEEYTIDADYEKKLRERSRLFKEVTKTRKSLLITFITTFGIYHNAHSGMVQNEVTMDDLFV